MGYISSIYESWVKLWPMEQATSLANLGRRIGLANGPDPASASHFAKTSSISNEINPQSGLLSQEFFLKRPLDFTLINPQSSLLNRSASFNGPK